MQKVDKPARHMDVISFNPAISHRKEKLALQLIRELGEIHKMQPDMMQVTHYEKWRERALELASELSPN
ncbi:hypothetical protein [Arsukibacterium perlucidum]|uniref:hypothetical protein n=1 Tax=Arsukibacterium perlucidum TaxID=368811 RepID=UPI000365B6BC|nr:hypothetical protein [Arsukibacterium perlucidum]